MTIIHKIIVDPLDDNNLIVKKCYTYNNFYNIVTYDKSKLTPENAHIYGMFRSVVMCKHTSRSRIVSFSPPKSISSKEYMEKYPEKTDVPIHGSEFVEGTMINLFFDSIVYKWEVCTKNSVGAKVKFYDTSNKTFSEMFFDACDYNGIDISTLNQNCVYSFVLQHPENRIVTPFLTPNLYLIKVYEIANELENDVFPIIIAEKELPMIKGVKYPKKYTFNTYEEAVDQFASENTEYTTMGVVIENIVTGERTKFRNPNYEQVKQLRGNQSKLKYWYLCLRQNGQLNNFLKMYPETAHLIVKYRDEIHAFTKELYEKYVECYIKKCKPLIEYSAKFRTHMYKLHEKFLSDRIVNNMNRVIKYVNELHPSLLMHSLNYDNYEKKCV